MHYVVVRFLIGGNVRGLNSSKIIGSSMQNFIHCPKCGHEWMCSSLNIKVTCPSCLLKIDRVKNTIRYPEEGNIIAAE